MRDTGSEGDRPRLSLSCSARLVWGTAQVARCLTPALPSAALSRSVAGSAAAPNSLRFARQGSPTRHRSASPRRGLISGCPRVPRRRRPEIEARARGPSRPRVGHWSSTHTGTSTEHCLLGGCRLPLCTLANCAQQCFSTCRRHLNRALLPRSRNSCIDRDQIAH